MKHDISITASTFNYKLYKKEKIKNTFYSSSVLFCSVCAPMSFSFFVHNKMNFIFAITSGTFFVLLIFVFLYLKVETDKKIDNFKLDLNIGMKIKRRSGLYLYQIVKESNNFYYLKDLRFNHQLMISKDKVQKEFEIEL